MCKLFVLQESSQDFAIFLSTVSQSRALIWQQGVENWETANRQFDKMWDKIRKTLLMYNRQIFLNLTRVF